MTTTTKREGKKQTPLTPFEKGRRAGKWSLSKVYENGFVSVKACLKKQEKTYGKIIADLEQKAEGNPDVSEQIQYLKGYLERTRETLSALIKQGHL